MSDSIPLATSPGASAAAALPPHPALGGYYPAQDDKRKFVDRLFARAAGDYDRIETIMALGGGRWYRREALIRAGLKPGMRVLDVAVGTGLVAREEIGIIGDRRMVVGLDPSTEMMRRAVAALGIQAILGIGERLPLAEGQFDFVSMGYALRHLGDVTAAFGEFFRVLKPGGRVCILEISRPRRAIHRAILRAYMRYIIPAIARLASRGRDSQLLWQYYWDTIDACVPPDTVLDCLHRCGFVEVTHSMELGMFSEYFATRPG
jgi:demethylmenaquinone methyltransferase/2-methoxy-6-polyprenyl-1,4-benzoquinol methylase